MGQCTHQELISHGISLRRALLIYIVVGLFLLFEMALQVSPSVLTNELMTQVKTNNLGLGIISGSYFITYSLAQIPAGFLFDRVHVKKVIPVCLVICSLGSLLLGLAQNFWIATMARMITGFGSSFAFIGLLVTASDLFKRRCFVLFAGIAQLIAAIGATSGQIPLGHLKAFLSFKEIMLFFALLGIILAVLTFLLGQYPKVFHENEKIGGLFKLIKEFLSIAGRRETIIISLYASSLWAPMSAFASLWGVPFLISHGYTVPESAGLVSLVWFGIGFGAPLLGFFAGRFSSTLFLIRLLPIIGIISFGSILLFKLHFIPLGILLFLVGVSSVGQVLSFDIVRSNNSESKKGLAISLNNMAIVLSGFILQPLIGLIVQTGNWGAASKQNITLGLSVLLLTYLIATVLGRYIRINVAPEDSAAS